MPMPIAMAATVAVDSATAAVDRSISADRDTSRATLSRHAAQDFGSRISSRWTALGVIGTAMVVSTAVTTYRDHGNIGDWHFFAEMSRQPTSRDGLTIYAQHPDIQSGPLSLLVIRLLDALGSAALPNALATLGIITVAVLERTRATQRRSDVPFLLGGVLVALWWPHVHVLGHIDDSIVLTLGSVVLLLVLRSKPIPAAVVLGLMLAVKPWAVFLIPLLVWRAAPGWRRFKPTLLCLGIGAALWSPFFIASVKTIDGFRPQVDVAPDSVLSLFRFGAGDVAIGPPVRSAGPCHWRGRRGDPDSESSCGCSVGWGGRASRAGTSYVELLHGRLHRRSLHAGSVDLHAPTAVDDRHGVRPAAPSTDLPVPRTSGVTPTGCMRRRAGQHVVAGTSGARFAVRYASAVPVITTTTHNTKLIGIGMAQNGLMSAHRRR